MTWHIPPNRLLEMAPQPAEAAVASFNEEIVALVDALRTSALTAGEQLENVSRRANAELKACREQEFKAATSFAADRKQFEDEKQEAARQNEIRERHVTLCVGGSHFTTTLTTLRRDPDSMLGVMFSGRHTTSTMADGSYFIDRDPTHFRYVLNFMRDGPCVLPPNDASTASLRRELLVEAQYYQIQGMIDALQDGPAARLARCAEAGGAIKQAEDDVRRGLQSADPAALAQALQDADALLVDVFSTRSAFRTDLAYALRDCPFVLQGAFERGWRQKEGGGLSVCARPDFLENWSAYTIGCLSRLDWTGIVAAGGSVLGCLLPVPPRFRTASERLYYFGKAIIPAEAEEGRGLNMAGRELEWFDELRGGYALPVDFGDSSMYDDTCGFEAADIDLFLVGLDHQQALDKIRHVYATLKTAWGDQDKMLIVRSDTSITFATKWPKRHVQIVLRRYRSIAEVIAGFDIDCCCIAFDGSRVWALPRSQRALNYGFNLVDPSRRSPTYEMRLYKYSVRGFSVAVPAFDAKVSPSVAQLPASETQGLTRLLLYSYHARMQKQKWPRWFLDTSEQLKGLEVPKSDYGPRSELEYLRFGPGTGCPVVDMAVFIQRVRRAVPEIETFPFVATCDEIERILHWPEGENLSAKGLKPEWLAQHHIANNSKPVTVPSEVQFISNDPGRQYITGAFHPDDRDWYAQAYGEADARSAA